MQPINKSWTQCINVHQQIFLYSKFLQPVQSFACQYNRLLLSSIYSDPVFFHWLICIFVYLNLFIWMSRQCSIFPLILLQSWSNLLSLHFYALALFSNFCFFEHANELIHEQIRIKLRSSHLELSYFVFKNLLKILLEKVISSTPAGWKLEALPKLNCFMVIFKDFP